MAAGSVVFCVADDSGSGEDEKVHSCRRVVCEFISLSAGFMAPASRALCPKPSAGGGGISG